MADTTTIRVDSKTHARLLKLGEANGWSLIDTVRAAAEALSRQHLAERVSREFTQLRKDESAWQDYLSEADSTTVVDGLG